MKAISKADLAALFPTILLSSCIKNCSALENTFPRILGAICLAAASILAAVSPVIDGAEAASPQPT